MNLADIPLVLPTLYESRFHEFDAYKGHFIIEKRTVLAHRRNLDANGNLHPLDDVGGVAHMFLWGGLVVLGTCALSFFTLALKRDEGKRRYHYLATGICSVATLAYYTMARGYGSVVLFDETVMDGASSPLRVFFWIRYIDWVFTTPMLILNLCFLAGTTKRLTYGLIASDIGMILTGLFAVVMGTSIKWMWYGVSCIFMVPIVFSLGFSLRRAAGDKSRAVQKTFTIVSWWTITIWTVYPILWVLAEGTRLIPLDEEIAIYSVLDCLAKGGMSIILVLSKSSIEVAELQEIDSVFSNLLTIKSQGFNDKPEAEVQAAEEAKDKQTAAERLEAEALTQQAMAAMGLASGRPAAAAQPMKGTAGAKHGKNTRRVPAGQNVARSRVPASRGRF